MSGSRGEKLTPALIRFYLGMLAVVVTDQITKYLAQYFLPHYSTLPVIENIFHLTLVYNKGIAFGLFRDHSPYLLLLISASLLVLFFFSRQIHKMPLLAQIGFSMILGGAIGNWMDRMRLGHVVDFLDFRIWPVFNLADTAITVGVMLYLVHLFRPEPRRT